MASAFKNYVLSCKEIRTPVKTLAGATFCHIVESGLFVVAIARHNVNAALVFELLHKIVETFKSYFQVVTEESIRKNFVLIYELLDEILDFGHPQLSSSVCHTHTAPLLVRLPLQHFLHVTLLLGQTGGAAIHHHARQGALRL